MLVFGKWTCNTNGRQAIFFRARDESRYQAQMIDQGFCFNACEWNFPDAPLRGLYARHSFVADLFKDQRIALAPLNRVERFAEELRQRLQ